MKKIIVLVSVCLCFGFSASAQDDDEEIPVDPAFVNKRGIDLLPQWGDFAIGIDASPFLSYLGNFFNQSGNNPAPLFKGVNQTIYGKYFLDDNRAIRGKLRLNIGSDVFKAVVRNDEETANNPLNPYATVIDVMKDNSTQVTLIGGYEFRRGHGRVQGFYGGEAGVGFGNGKQKYVYANPMTAANQTPSTWDFGYGSANNPVSRPIEEKKGNAFNAIIGGFAGVEYFFAPKMSIGGELNLSFVYSVTMQSETTNEFWNVSTDKVDTQSSRSGDWRGNEIGLYTVPTGVIFLMFHF